MMICWRWTRFLFEVWWHSGWWGWQVPGGRQEDPRHAGGRGVVWGRWGTATTWESSGEWESRVLHGDDLTSTGGQDLRSKRWSVREQLYITTKTHVVWSWLQRCRGGAGIGVRSLWGLVVSVGSVRIWAGRHPRAVPEYTTVDISQSHSSLFLLSSLLIVGIIMQIHIVLGSPSVWPPSSKFLFRIKIWFKFIFKWVAWSGSGQAVRRKEGGGGSVQSRECPSLAPGAKSEHWPEQALNNPFPPPSQCRCLSLSLFQLESKFRRWTVFAVSVSGLAGPELHSINGNCIVVQNKTENYQGLCTLYCLKIIWNSIQTSNILRYCDKQQIMFLWKP